MLVANTWSYLFEQVQCRVDFCQQTLDLLAYFRSRVFVQPFNEMLFLGAIVVISSTPSLL
jgi:hypothetical protein